MSFLRLPSSKFYLFLVLGVAFVLRFTCLTGFSLSNDELSALSRLQFDSLSMVITEGVYVDYHPAGVEVFLYFWTKLFGFSEWMIRFPFALMGVISVYLLYRIGKSWFGETTGLLAAAALAVLEYPVLYSQIARPYSPGLLFSLLATWYWTRIFFRDSAASSSRWRKTSDYIGFALSVSACMYIHYFSFIFAGILCFTGLFFLKRNQVVSYLMCGILIVLLYLPHVNIFMHQLAKGGVGGEAGWLGPPESDAFIKYIEYCFNDSTGLRYLFWIIAGGTILAFRGKFKLNRFHLLSILFFGIPFAIAYYYSIWRNPVFQFSVLLFSFPYLLLLLFSFIPGGKTGVTAFVLLSVLLAGGIYSTVVEKKYYSTSHFSEFRDIAKGIKKLDEKYGATNITRTINIFSPYYINYYLEKINHEVKFAMYSIMTPEERKEFLKVLEEAKTPHFVYAFSNTYDPPEFDMIIRSKFPRLVYRDSMLNSGLRLYSTDTALTEVGRHPVFTYSYGFESLEWNNENTFRDSSLKYKGTYSVHIPEDAEYGPGYMHPISVLMLKPGSVLEMSAEFYSGKNVPGAKLVLSIDKGDSTYLWKGVGLNEYYRDSGWYRVFLAVDIPGNIPGDGQVKIYCWNEKKEDIRMDDFVLNVYSPR